jgi:polyhydroxybutyrate depolymerase
MTDDLVTRELRPGGPTRTYTVRPPRQRDAALVLLLHGNMSGAGSSTPAGLSMHEWTTFAAHADEWGITVCYPDGHLDCWADGRGVTAADEAGVDDVAFLRAVIDGCAAEFGTAPDRTLVAGISNGAFMSHRLALTSADRIAVFAAVAGGLPADLAEIRPTHAVSAMLINGDADPLVPTGGGYSRHRGPGGELRGRTLGAAETAAHWRAIDRCDGATEITDDTERTSRRTVTGGVGGTRVTAWTVHGGGHTWPGAPVPDEWAGSPAIGIPAEFDAAVAIWHFAQPLLIPASQRRR